MIIKFQPMRCDAELSVAKSGDVLTINGEDFDFGPLADGAVLPMAAVACPMLAADVRRESGELIVTLTLPHGASPTPEVAFPADIVAVPDGAVEIPS